jgi:maltooligosyltrehalose trehalohydrolase
MTGLFLLGPNTPMLFQGQEFASSKPFVYFADHTPELAPAVRVGREKFLSQFPSLSDDAMQARLADPAALETFLRCQLDFNEREKNSEAYALHRDLLRLRREDPVFSQQGLGGIDGAVLGTHAFVLRFFAADENDRLLVCNLGRDLRLSSAPEPLIAPPQAMSWEIRWSSEDPMYGGRGIAPLETDEGWLIPGHSSIVLSPVALLRA